MSFAIDYIMHRVALNAASDTGHSESNLCLMAERAIKSGHTSQELYKRALQQKERGKKADGLLHASYHDALQSMVLYARVITASGGAVTPSGKSNKTPSPYAVKTIISSLLKNCNWPSKKIDLDNIGDVAVQSGIELGFIPHSVVFAKRLSRYRIIRKWAEKWVKKRIMRYFDWYIDTRGL